MKKAIGLCAALMMTSTCALTGHAEPGDPDEVVASVDGVTLLRKDMDKTIGAIVTAQNISEVHQTEAHKYLEKGVVNNFVVKTLLKNDAKQAGITVTDEDRKKHETQVEANLKRMGKTLDQYFKESPFGEETARKEFEENILIEKLIRAKVLDAVEVDDAEVEKVIADAKARNAALEEAAKQAEPKEAKRTKIEGLKKQLDEGADFAELAKAHSDCPSGARGGDLGTFQRGMMVKPFEDAAFAQEIGKVGDIVETQFGYHLIRVTAKNPAAEANGDAPAKPESVAASHILVKIETPQQPPTPVPAAEEVREQLKRQKSQPAIMDYIKALKGKAKIETVVPIDLE